MPTIKTVTAIGSYPNPIAIATRPLRSSSARVSITSSTRPRIESGKVMPCAFFGQHARLADPQAFADLSRAAAQQRMGGLLQTPVRRPRGSVALSSSVIPTASLSPTAAWSHSTTTASPSNGRTIGHGEAERLGGLEIDRQLEPGRPLYRKIGGLGASEDAIRVRRGAAECLVQIGAVGDQAATLDGTSRGVAGRFFRAKSCRQPSLTRSLRRRAAGWSGT